MECNLQMMSPELGLAGNDSDAKYVSKLSTILVATIQEAKDRISQIEYVFCHQLYPNVLLNHQSFQKMYSESREAAESGYKEKEKDLLHQIKNLEYEKQQVLDENHLLKSEKEKFVSMEKLSCNHVQELQQELKQKNIEVNEVRKVIQNLQKDLELKSSYIRDYEKAMKDLEAKNYTLMKMQKKLEVEIRDLQLELQKKSIEVDEQIDLKSKLLQQNQSNASLIAKKDAQLKEYEEETNELASRLRNMENKVNELMSEIRDKTEEVCKGNKLKESLQMRIEFQDRDLVESEQLLSQYREENRLLAVEVWRWRNCEKLEKGLENKPTEPQEKEKVQPQLFSQSDTCHSGRIKRESAVDEFEEERKQLLDKQKSLQEKIEKLQHRLSENLAVYKNVKSQYIYLLKKYGHTEETMLSMPLEKIENGSKTVIHNQSPSTSLDIENHNSKAPRIISDVTEAMGKEGSLEDKKGVVSVQRSSPVSPSSSRVLNAPKCTSITKPCPSVGAKRPLSYWRDTRSHQSRVGPDPHDDFLDTPLENARGNLGKIMKEDVPEEAPMNMIVDNSDDEETQDIANAGPQKLCKSPAKAGTAGFKYVEPVRKKSERDNLKGVECKQCKKFYDAVLPDTTNGKKNIRCEHHDGVSRHRYRYAPPMTPEGFWNIGFESEM